MTLITCKQGSYSGGVFGFRKYPFRYQDGISGQMSSPRRFELAYFKDDGSDVVKLSGIYLWVPGKFV